MVIDIIGKEGKDLQDAIKLLKDNGFEFETDHAFNIFCKEEADFRLTEMGNVEAEDLNRLEEMNIYDDVVDCIKQDFIEKEIFDYDYMDQIVRDCVSDYLI